MAELHDAADALRQSFLQAFVTEFVEAVKKDGNLQFSSTRIQPLRKKLRGEISVLLDVVQQVVRAIELDGVEVCKRLDVGTFCLVVEILTKAPPSVAQERGLYLLMESLQDNTSHSIAYQALETDVDEAGIEERKAQIGTQLLIGLLEYFADNEMQDRARRWTGLLIAELVRNCESNQQLLDMAPEDLRRVLGSIITDEKNQVLKLVSGSIIRVMLAAGSPIESFWPLDILDDVTTQFPESVVPASQWIGRFELFLDHLYTLKVLKDTNSEVYLAYAVAADHSHFEGEGAAIAVTVSDVLSIVVPATPTSPVQYIDVSLEDISEFEIHKMMLQPKWSHSNHEPMEAIDLLVRLLADQDKNYRLNAAFHHTKELHITYQHLEDAEDIVSYIRDEQASRKEHSVAHSTTVDKLSMVPEELAISRSDAKARNDSQSPLTVANQERVTDVSASQRFKDFSPKIFKNSDKDPTNTSKISYSAPLATEAASRPTGAESGLETSAATERLVQPPEMRNGALKPEIYNSDKWQEGRAIIDNAEEFRSPSSKRWVRTTSTDTHRSISLPSAAIVEDEGLYDVSPRGAKLHEERRNSQQVDTVGFPKVANQSNSGVATEIKKMKSIPVTQSRKLKDRLRDQDGRLSKGNLGEDDSLPRPDGMTSASTSNKRVPKKPSKYTNAKLRTKVHYQSKRQNVNEKDTEESKNGAPDPDIFELPGSEQLMPDPKPTRVLGKATSRTAAAQNLASRIQTSNQPQPRRPGEIRVKKDIVVSLSPTPAEDTLGDGKGNDNIQEPKSRNKVFKANKTKSVATTRRPGQKVSSKAEPISIVGSNAAAASVETFAPSSPSTTRGLNANVHTKSTKPTKALKKGRPEAAILEPRSTRAAALKANQKILKLNLAESTEKTQNSENAENGEMGDIEAGANKHESPQLGQQPLATEIVAPFTMVYKAPVAGMLAQRRGQRSRRRRISSTATHTEVNSLKVDNNNKADTVQSRQEATLHGNADSVLQNQEEASSKARNQNGLQILNSDGAPDSEEVNIVDYQSPVAAEGRLSDPVNHHFEDAVLAMQDDGSEIPEDKAFKEPVVAVVVAPDTQDYPRDNEGQSMALKIKGALAPLASPPGQNDAVRKPSSILKKRQGVKKDVPIASNIRINRKDTAHTQVVAKRPIGPPPQPPIGHVALPSESNMGNRATRHIHQSPSRIKAIESVHMVRQKNESKENSHSQQSVVISVSSKGSEKDTYYTDEDDEEIEQLNTPRPKNKSKRKADNIDVRHGAKRAKTNATSNTRATTAVGHRKASPDRRELFTQVLVDDYLHRKAPIISFSAKGPRNQGVILAKKPGRGPHDDTAEGNPETGRHLSIKRKHDHDTDKRAKAAANTSAVKRLKLGRPIPHTGDSALETAPKSGSPPIAKPFQKQGSQGKKVAENGSPIAISYNPDLGNGPYERLHDLFVNGDGHSHHYASLNFGDDEVDDDVLLPNDDLPLLKSEEPPETDPEGMILSSNRKPPPDSPSAPSKTLAAFSAHRVQSGGKFVNVKTAKVVKAAEPPDPFISVEPARTSSFMDKLRARNYPNHKEDFPNSKDVPRLPRVQPQENDPDKTLVNDPAEDDEVFSPSIILASATSMSSGSTNTTHHTNESRAESEPDPEKEWRDALKPHQRNMLDILYQISNRLVRHLVDKETATEDIVHDYQRGGTRLIEELERAHQAEYARFQRDINTAKTELKAEYKTTMEQIIEGNREIRQRPVAALRMEHMDKQQHLNELLEAAYRALD